MHPIAHWAIVEEAVERAVLDRWLTPVGHQHRVIDGSEDHEDLENDGCGRDWEDVIGLLVNLLLAILALFLTCALKIGWLTYLGIALLLWCQVLLLLHHM